MSVFEARHNPVGAKRRYGSKVSTCEFIKVTSGLMGPIRKGDVIKCISNGRKGAGEFTIWFKGVQNGFTLIPTQLGSQRYNTLEETNRNKINVLSWCWNTMTGVHPWICQKTSKQKFLTPTSNQTWLRAAVRKFNSGTDMYGMWLGAQYNSYRRFFPLSNGYLQELTW
jgi:hypothetical protein